MTQSTTTPTQRLRVLYLSWRDRENPEAGGAETFTERTSEVLTQQGHEVTIFTAAFAGSSPRTRHGDVDVVRRGSKFSVYLHGMLHVLRHRDDYDVVLIETLDLEFGEGLGVLTGETGAGKTIIAISHDDRYFDVADRIYRLDYGQLVDYDRSSESPFQVVR